MPVCSKCGFDKAIEAFYPAKTKRGCRSQCKPCQNETRKAEYQRSKDREQQVARKWRKDNQDRYSLWAAEYSCRPEIRERNNTQRSERRKRHGRKEKVYSHPNKLIRGSLSSRINYALRNVGVVKTIYTSELLGCSIEQFRAHIQLQWLPGMTWENRGVWKRDTPMTWHIDHITPCAAFDLTREEEQRKCFHYTNCRPIWALDNYMKCDKIEINGKLVRASLL